MTLHCCFPAQWSGGSSEKPRSLVLFAGDPWRCPPRSSGRHGDVVGHHTLSSSGWWFGTCFIFLSLSLSIYIYWEWYEIIIPTYFHIFFGGVAQPPSHPSSIRFFLQIDLDGSGSLTKQEFFRATKQRSSVNTEGMKIYMGGCLHVCRHFRFFLDISCDRKIDTICGGNLWTIFFSDQSCYKSIQFGGCHIPFWPTSTTTACCSPCL